MQIFSPPFPKPLYLDIETYKLVLWFFALSLVVTGLGGTLNSITPFDPGEEVWIIGDEELIKGKIVTGQIIDHYYAKYDVLHVDEGIIRNYPHHMLRKRH